METGKMKLALSAGALALSLALAGCGGGGTAAVMEEEVTPPPTPKPASGSVSVTGMAATQILAKLRAEKQDSAMRTVPAGEKTSIGDVEFSCDSAYACQITFTNSAGTLVVDWTSMTLADGTAMVMATDTTMRDLQVGNYFPAVEDAVRRGVTYRGAAKTTVKYDGNDLVIELGGPLDRDGDGTGMTLAKDGVMEPMAPMVANNLPGRPQPVWHANRLQKTWDDDHMTDAIVYTNREPDMTRPFEDKYDQNMIDIPTAPATNNRGVILNPDSNVVATTKGHVDAVGMVDDMGTAGDATDDKWVPNPLVKFNYSRSSTPNAVTMFTNTSTAGADERNSVSGTYDGAMGTYYCATASGCYLNAKGEPVKQDGMMFVDADPVPEWHFVPNVGAVITTTKEWLAFGVWSTEPEIEGNSHNIGHIVTGSNMYNKALHGDGTMTESNTSSAIAYLQGKATYKGDAAGYYTHQRGNDRYSGEFTADAMLMADFDAELATNADMKVGHIDGRIVNFKGEEGHDFITSWAVTLGASPLNAGSEFMRYEKGHAMEGQVMTDANGLPMYDGTRTPGMLYGLTSGAGGDAGGRTGWAGEWAGNLYGFKAHDEDDDLSNLRGEHLPEGVAGHFYASHTDRVDSAPSHGESNVTGAFGAMKE